MKSRIAIWATVGAIVVVVWRVYISATLSNPLGTGGLGRALVYLTCPIAMASRHHPQGFYFVVIANAALYALAGVVVETTRRYYNVRSRPADPEPAGR
jgi:hypothetical protein